MSIEIFKWQPHQAEFGGKSLTYSTIKSEFETGAEQRRMRFGRGVGKWKFVYKMHLLSPTNMIRLQDEILDFFNRMKGSYDNFYLPSWEYECKYLAKPTNTSLTVGADASIGGALGKLGFTTAAGQQGNFLYVSKRNGYDGEVGKVSASGSSSLTVNWTTNGVASGSSFVNSYVSGSALVQKAYLVRFESDELDRSWFTPFAWEKEIGFVEDIGALNF